MVWCSHLSKYFPQFFVIHTVKSFAVDNKAEADVFLELALFFDDPRNVSNLISGSSAFSKSSLNIWNFTVHVLLKPGLGNFDSLVAANHLVNGCLKGTKMNTTRKMLRRSGRETYG